MAKSVREADIRGNRICCLSWHDASFLVGFDEAFVRMVDSPATSAVPVTALSRYATFVSVGLAVITFMAAVAIDAKRKSAGELESHMKKAAAAGAIPTAFLLIYGAFDPSIISQLSGLNVPIAAAGLALLYISVRTVLK